MMTVTLFRDFLEDQRTSMEIYANELSGALRPFLDGKLRLQEYRPAPLPFPKRFDALNRIRMRLSRYISYPCKARHYQGDINHISDHGYSHLLHILDPARTIVTVHDIIPILHWKGSIYGMKTNRRPWLNEFSFKSLKRAKHIIAVSENTKADLISYCGCLEQNITVVYYGLNKKLRQENQNERARLRHSFGFPDQNTHLVLIMGEAEYKNQLTSLKVFSLLRELCRKPVRLVRLGRKEPKWESALKESGLGSQVFALDFMEAEKMANIYNSVDCLLFPSWYEGFGWPPLEAMACGTPAVTSNAASLLEVVGDVALTANPDDVDGLAEAVYQVLEETKLRRVLVQRGIERANAFTWEKNARETIDIYEKILENNKK